MYLETLLKIKVFQVKAFKKMSEWKCDIRGCTYTGSFPTLEDLNQHKLSWREHLQEENLQLLCGRMVPCDKTFVNNRTLMQHVRKYHPDAGTSNIAPNQAASVANPARPSGDEAPRSDEEEGATSRQEVVVARQEGATIHLDSMTSDQAIASLEAIIRMLKLENPPSEE